MRIREAVCVLAGMAACGSSDGSGGGPSGDEVTVTVTDQGSALVGVPVYFVNPDSTLASKPTTDSSGTASAVVGAGGSVTAVIADMTEGGTTTVELQHYTSVPSVDTAAQQVVWTVGTTGLAPDAEEVELSATRGDTRWSWGITAPGSVSGAVPIPKLPADIFDFAIDASDDATVELLATLKLPAGYRYADFRDDAPLPTNQGSGARTLSEYVASGTNARALHR